METETIMSLLVALIGALGLKEGWNIWKKKIDNSASFKSSLREDNKKRITELENKVAELYKKIELLMEENATLKANIARLEERILITAKNRIKTNEKV